MRTLRRPDLLIFDCDGVLIDSQAIQCRVDAAVLTRLGYAITAEDVGRKFIGVSTQAMVRHVEGLLGRPLPITFEAERDRLVDAAYRRELKAVEGVGAAIAALGLRVCVASNAQTDRLHHALRQTGLSQLFTPHIFGADLVARPKPEPDLFFFCAERMRVARAACLVIEDSVTGVRAAVAAGMPVVGFYGGSHCFEGYERLLLEAGADAVCRDMADLAALVALPERGAPAARSPSSTANKWNTPW